MNNWRAWIPGTAAARMRRDETVCRRTKERIQQIVDGELPRTAANDALLRHVEACARCGEEARTVRELKTTIRSALEGSGKPVLRAAEAAARRALERPD